MRQLLALVFCGISASSFAQDLGKIGGIERSVLLGSAAALKPAKLGQPFERDQQVRTMRRSKAILNFNDRSQLRVNERTDLVIRPAADLKRYRLESGAVWLKVPKGLKVEVETPVLTAAVRGTEFEVTAEGEVRVYDGAVEVSHNGQRYMVERGSYYTPGRGLRVIDGSELPVVHGGPVARWWETIVEDRHGPATLNPDPVMTNRLIDYWNEKGGPFPVNTAGPQFDFESPQRDFYSALGAAAALASGGGGSAVALEGGLSTVGGDVNLTLAQARAGVALGKATASLLFEARTDTRGTSGWQSRLPSESMFKFAGGGFAGRGVVGESAVRVGPLSHGMLNDRLSGAGIIQDRKDTRYVAAQFASVMGNSEVIGLSKFVGGSRFGANLANSDGDLTTELNFQLASFDAGIEPYFSWQQAPGSGGWDCRVQLGGAV